MTKNQQKNRLSSIDAPIGRIMPNALELEDAVIGALLAEPSSFSKIDNVISPDDFYNQSNAIIFKAMRNLASKRAPIDMLTVTEELNSMGELKNIGGAYRISELSSKVAGASHIGYHARIIKDKSMARKLIEITSKAQSSAYDSSEDISDTMEQLEKDYTELVSDTSNEESINLSEAISESLKQAENTQSLRNKGVHVAIPTNLSSLNDIFAGGWRAPDLIVVGGRPSMGKALRMDAKILTPYGWKLNKDIRIGDEVSSIDGKPSFVTGVFPQGHVKTYKILFSDGREIECCGSHLWSVQSCKFSKNANKVLSTLEIMNLLSMTKYQKRISIPLFSGITGTDKQFVIPPYLMGVLLGDGILGSGVVWCKPDQFIVDKIKSMVDYEVKKTRDYFVIINANKKSDNKYRRALHDLGLFGKCSHEKFIPKCYLESCREQRIMLLNGLLDTDGDIDKNGAICYNTVSPMLAKDVQTLCWSLGYKCSLSKRRSYLYGERKRDSYRLYITAPNPHECFTLPRKSERARIRKCKPLTIVSVTPTNRYVECQCISVSHEKALFITDDYIVTHNTQHALAFAKAAAIAGKHVLFASIEMTATQLVNRFLLEDERISGYNLRTGQMSPEEWGAIDEMSGKLWNLPIHIAGGSSIRNLSNIKSEARRLKRKGQLDLLIIDYLTLIKTNIAFQSRYLEVGYITGELKNLAKELNIPVILLSQLSRPQKGVEIREPRLEDLRESGDIEQDADIVLFIHRPDYYEPDAIDSNGVPWKNRGKIIISKYREGARNNSVIFYNDSQYKKIGDNPFPVSYSPF
ncbi:DnaB-like helicase C-terminal domain-containing protein [Parabacteroides sp. APC149_11_2_Y6]